MNPRGIRSIQEAYLDIYQDNIVEEFKDLTPEKEGRVKTRVSKLTDEIADYNAQVQHGIDALKRRQKNPVARALLGTRGPKRRLAQLLSQEPQIKKYITHASNAMDALNRTNAGRRASIIHQINQTREQIKELGVDPDVATARSNIRRFRRTQSESYDILISYLLDEGYANTHESACVILENMSDDWVNYVLYNFYE